MGASAGVTTQSVHREHLNSRRLKRPATSALTTKHMGCLLGNATDLPISEHATDTHGVTLVNFALFDLVGKAAVPADPGPGQDHPVPDGHPDGDQLAGTRTPGRC